MPELSRFCGMVVYLQFYDNILKQFDYSLGFLQWLDGTIDIAPEKLISAGTVVQPAEYVFIS